MKRFLSVILCLSLVFSLVNIGMAYTDVMKVGDQRSYTSSNAFTSYPVYGGSLTRIHQWYTSDSSVVRIVSFNGATCTIQAVGPGTATVSNKQTLSYTTYGATGERPCYEQGLGDLWKITVNPVDPTGISLPSTFTVEAESYDSISATFTPANAFSELTWESSKTSIATVEDGTIYGVAPGTADVTVRTANGYSDTTRVTVTTPQNIFSVVSPADGRTEIDKNTDIKFTYNNKLTQGTAYSSIKLYDNTTKKTANINKATDGKNLILTPVNALSPGHSYTATVPAKALKNMYGVANATAVSTTFEIAPLQIVSSSPENESFDIDVNKAIEVKFDAPIEEGSKWSNISVRDADGNPVNIKKSVSGETLTVTPQTNWDYYTKYTVSIPAGAVACDTADSESELTLSFKTIRDADVVYPPEFSMQNGTLTITAEPDTLIYYTLEGGLPLVSGKLYTSPLQLPYKEVQVRAIAVRNGKTSTESEYKYTNDITAFATSLGCRGYDGFYDVAADTDGFVTVGHSNSDDFYYGDWEDVYDNELYRGEYDATIVKYDNANNVVWKKNFGGSSYDYFNSVVTTEDGYVTVGESEGCGDGDWAEVPEKGSQDAIIVKFDKDGNIIWKKNFGSSDTSCSFSSVIAEEDGYIAVGNIFWYDSLKGTHDLSGIYGNGDDDGLIVKFDFEGNVLWKKLFGGNRDDSFYDITKAENGYIAVGCSEWKNTYTEGTYDWEGIYGNGDFDSIMVKFDKNGNVIWKKHFGGYEKDEFTSVAAVEDGYVAIGHSHEDSFETGDLEDESFGYGSSNSIAVKYDENGNIIWKKNYTNGNDEFDFATATDNGFAVAGQRWISNYGVNALMSEYDKDGNLLWSKIFGGDDDRFLSVTKNEEGVYIAVGSSWSETFDSLEGAGIENKGNADAIVLKYSNKTSWLDKYITPKSDTIAISGSKSAVHGDEITVPLYFTPASDTTAVNVKITHPEGISLIRTDSDYEFIYFEETDDGVVVTADLSDVLDIAPAGESCVLANLIFRIDPSLPEGKNAIFIDNSETFYMDEDYNTLSFGNSEDYIFNVVPLAPKAISVSGNPEISGPTQYKASFLPENAESKVLVWSVSDERLASIDQTGLLTPLKNGELKVILTEPDSGMSRTFDVVISNIKTYINEIKTDTGMFNKEYTPYETERTLYVPKGTTSLNLTLDYNSGNATSGGGMFFKNVAKKVSFSSLPYELTLTKKESGCDSTNYKITIMENPKAELYPEFKITDKEIILDIMSKTYSDAMLIVAVYDKGKLKTISTSDLPAGELNVIMRTALTGDKLKLILVDKDTLTPQCKEYNINY